MNRRKYTGDQKCMKESSKKLMNWAFPEKI
jgi:hypothetical protein